MRFRSTLLVLALMFSCVSMSSIASAQEKETTKKSKKKGATTPDAAPAAAAPAAESKATKGAPANSAGISDSDISKAQSSGMVWVNTDSGVYHKSGRFYGKTKQGKFMSEADAKKANYRESKQEVGSKK